MKWNYYKQIQGSEEVEHFMGLNVTNGARLNSPINPHILNSVPLKGYPTEVVKLNDPGSPHAIVMNTYS
jgi:hypothetical protein